MKKLIAICFAAVLATSSQAGCWWSWWVGDEKADQVLSGCQLGVATECKEMTGAQVSLLWGRVERLNAGAQVAFGYCNAREVRNGVQAAVVNVADAAALQFGLLNWNKKGFLPFFPFFNMSKGMFGSGK